MERHADAAVAAAVEMQHAVGLLGGLRRRGLQVRVGIASGPITAGVIGEHRYTYDMWGDTVNMASRMESHGLPGQIQVAESTRTLLTTSLPWTERSLEVKGKGQVRTFVLNPDAVRPVALRRAPAAQLPAASLPDAPAAGTTAVEPAPAPEAAAPSGSVGAML
jgi:guanylate cyclase